MVVEDLHEAILERQAETVIGRCDVCEHSDPNPRLQRRMIGEHSDVAAKQQLTVRLDADVVVWLRQQGKGYQTRLNKVLREAMLEDFEKSA